MEEKYIAIDLKSFYASVECVERGLDPLTTNLVVADTSRTEKTICLAVSPSLKSWGVPSRPRLFEVVAKVKEINNSRRWSAPNRRLVSATYNNTILCADNSLALDYIAAAPRMGLYIEYSRRIYGIYLKYFAPEDIHVYSVDEVFIDATHYLKTYKKTARELTEAVINDVLAETGITATAGIGTNLYLCKVAMDIVAKHLKPNKNGVRIAEINENIYKKMLWEHKPLTDFWRVGKGYEKKLISHGMYTMGDIALKSLENEDLLYKLFGINAELLIDHAWGKESCTMANIKSYKPLSKSLSTGQVLQCPYKADKARLITREMCDLLVLDMVEKEIATNSLTLTIGYDTENIAKNGEAYTDDIVVDYYGRMIPKHAHGTVNFPRHTSSSTEIVNNCLQLYDKIVDKHLTVRRINVTVCNLLPESEGRKEKSFEELDLFTDIEETEAKERRKREEYEKEKRAQKALIEIRRRHGKNAILKGMNFEDGATAIERNLQIGGHKA